MTSGTDAEFATYVASRQRHLLQLAHWLTGDFALSEDLVQDALAKAWRHWRSVQQAGDPDSYVRRILMNTFLSGARRRWRGEQPSDTLPEPSVGIDGADQILLRLAVEASLGRLPRKQRAVLLLRFFEDLSVEQAAAELDWPVGTVKSTTSKALAALRGDIAFGALVGEAS